jgi:MFS family permease
MRATFQPLRIPSFRPLAAAYTVNEVGNWLGDIALAVVVWDRTGSALATAALFVGMRFVPAFVGPAVLARAEGLATRVALPAMYALEALAFVALAVLVGHFTLPGVVALAALDGTLAVASRALTRATAAAVLKPAGLLRQGNGLLNYGFTAAGAVGPALGGVVTAGAGARTALLLDAGSFLLVAAILAATRGFPEPEREAVPWRSRLHEGLRYVARRRLVGRLLGAQAAAMVFFATVIPVEVVYAKDTLDAGDAGYGTLLASWGIGMLAGSLVFTASHRRSLGSLLAGSVLAVAASYLGMAAAPTLAVACVAAVVGGLGNGIEVVSLVSAIQELTESGYQARVMALLESLSASMPAIGFLVGGAVAALASPRATFLVGGLGILVVVAAAAARLAPAARRQVEVEAETAPPGASPAPSGRSR